MNTYQTRFWAKCPINQETIYYDLEIKTTQIIKVEDLISELTDVVEAYHEDIADQLHDKFGGSHTMTAEHHGVTITTHRP